MFNRFTEAAKERTLEAMKEIVRDGGNRAYEIRKYRVSMPRDLLARIDEAATVSSKVPEGPDEAAYLLGRVAALLSAWGDDRSFFLKYEAAEKNIKEFYSERGEESA